MKCLALFLILILLSSSVKADEIDTLMVTVISTLVKADDSDEKRAVKYAQRAFIKTFGFEAEKKRYKRYRNQMINEAREWAEENLPDSAEATLGAMFFAYKVITGTVKIPLGKDMNLRVGRQEVFFEMDF